MIHDNLQDWAWGQTIVRFTTTLPPVELVQGVRVIAHNVDGRFVVCTDDQGRRFLPGGTREPGETCADCLRRELAEETGAIAVSTPRWFGAHVGLSYHSEAYRPHSPFPLKAWLWGYVRVDGVDTARRTGGGGNEVIVSVDLVPVDEVLDQIATSRRGCAEAFRALTRWLRPTTSDELPEVTGR